MQDKSVARQVAPDGSRLGIMPTTSGGVATQPRAPGADIPLATTAGAPGHGRPLAASSGAAGHDRPRATPRAPGADVPLATTAGVPGQRCPSAAHWARDHFRSRPAPTAPGHDRPLAASSGATRHDRPRATLQAPVQDVPRALAVRVPGSDRPCALAATAAAPDGSHVLHPMPGPDSSHRGPDAGPRPTSLTDPTTPAYDLYGRAYTAEEVQQLTQADWTPLFDAEARLLQVLIQRVVVPGHPPARRQHHRRRGAAVRRRQRAKRLDTLATVGRALDVLRPLLEDRQALAPESESALFQLLDEAAKYMDDSPPPADAHDEIGASPSDLPIFHPLKTSANLS